MLHHVMLTAYEQRGLHFGLQKALLDVVRRRVGSRMVLVEVLGDRTRTVICSI